MNFESVIASLYQSVNPLMMFAIAGWGVILHRAERITTAQSLLWPMYAGVVYGGVLAMGHARGMDGWIRPEVLMQLLIESAIINGFAAGLTGQGLSAAWGKLFGTPQKTTQQLSLFPDPSRDPLVPPAPLAGTRDDTPPEIKP